MARKDNKGRNLKTGEYQRPDGRYEYRYKDEITGKRNSVYAADLASLREMEKKINKDMDDLLITDASVKKLTVNTLFERYMATKNIKERTKKNYIRRCDGLRHRQTVRPAAVHHLLQTDAPAGHLPGALGLRDRHGLLRPHRRRLQQGPGRRPQGQLLGCH